MNLLFFILSEPFFIATAEQNSLESDLAVPQISVRQHKSLFWVPTQACVISRRVKIQWLHWAI